MAWVPRARGRLLFGGGVGLHLQTQAGDLLDVSRFAGGVAICGAGGYAEVSGQEQHRSLPQCGDEFDCGDAGQKAVGGGFGGGEAEEAGDLDRGRAVRLRDDEDAFGGVLRGDHGVFRLGVQADGAGEFAVVDPVAEHELVLVLDAGVDEVAEQAALDAVVGFGRIVGRPVGHAATDEAVGVVAAAGDALAGDRLAARVDAAHVGADGAAQSPWDRPSRRR